MTWPISPKPDPAPERIETANGAVFVSHGASGRVGLHEFIPNGSSSYRGFAPEDARRIGLALISHADLAEIAAAPVEVVQ